MIWRHLFPPNGGGSLRRWYKLKTDLLSQTFKKRKTQHGINQPISLFDFRRQNDVVDALSSPQNKTHCWRLSDDAMTLGGYSRGVMSLIRDEEDLKRDLGMSLEERLEEMAGGASSEEEKKEEEEKKKEEEEKKEEKKEEEEEKEKEKDSQNDDDNNDNDKETNFIPFLRWRGQLSTTLPSTHNTRVIRSGYCYIRSPEFVLNAAKFNERYNALELTCRTDGRIYTVNLKVESYFPGDLYQGFITVPSSTSSLRNEGGVVAGKEEEEEGEFVTLVLPFKDFVLTSNGREVVMQRELDGRVNIEHIGFMLADGVDGEFRFDLARIRAINYVEKGKNREGGVIGEEEEDEDEDEDSLEWRRRNLY